MRTLVIALFVAFALQRAAAPYSSMRDEVSLASVRVTDDWLQERGFTADQSKFAVGELLAWMHDLGTLSDSHFQTASLAMFTMLDDGAADLSAMRSLCSVAPRCLDYMSAGTALSVKELSLHLRRHDLEARDALAKMLAVAGNHHVGHSDEWSIISDARELK